MTDYLPLILLAPLFISGAIAVYHSRSLWSVGAVVLGAIVGAILIAFSGVYWLYVFHESWMQSQGAGFIFLPVILPFCGYTGFVTGSSLTALLYGYTRHHLPWIGFIMLSIGLAVVLGGLIPSAIAAVPAIFTSSGAIPSAITFLISIGGGVASAWVASQLSAWVLSGLCNMMNHQ